MQQQTLTFPGNFGSRFVHRVLLFDDALAGNDAFTDALQSVQLLIRYVQNLQVGNELSLCCHHVFVSQPQVKHCNARINRLSLKRINLRDDSGHGSGNVATGTPGSFDHHRRNGNNFFEVSGLNGSCFEANVFPSGWT